MTMYVVQNTSSARATAGGFCVSAARRVVPRARSRPAQFGPWQLAVLLAALLAFSWQSFVTQTHVHPAPHAYSLTASGKAEPAAHSRADEPSPDQPANCPICQEIAHAGLYLLPTTVAFDVPAPATAWVAVAATLAPQARASSHAWRSRAPPHQLQA